MPNVKGAAVTARLRFVRERFGDAGFEQLVAALSPAHHEIIEARVLPQAWVPYELFIDLCVQADQQFGKGDLGLCFEMGRYAAEVNLPSIYRLFYRFGRPAFVLSKAARLWSLHYDSGALLAHDDGNGTFRLTIERFEQPHRAHCLSVLGWATKSIELSGGRVQSAEEPQCRTLGAPVCEIAVAWT